jgi:serine kinase of HPr protein (carbohydrate metabolism regulator)
MNVKELAEKANLKILSGEQGLSNEIQGGYTCDLLSDVMGHAEEGYVWITLQTHKNVMAIASLKELAAVILVKGLEPEADTLEQSNRENIPILSTGLEAFEISGLVYHLIK